jgi:hypothetical protein
MRLCSSSNTSSSGTVPRTWRILSGVIVAETSGLFLIAFSVKVRVGHSAIMHCIFKQDAVVVGDGITLRRLEGRHALRWVGLGAAVGWDAGEVYSARSEAVGLAIAEILDTRWKKVGKKELVEIQRQLDLLPGPSTGWSNGQFCSTYVQTASLLAATMLDSCENWI